MSNPNKRSGSVSDELPESPQCKESEGPDSETKFLSEECASCADSTETKIQATGRKLEASSECEEGNTHQTEATRQVLSRPSVTYQEQELTSECEKDAQQMASTQQGSNVPLEFQQVSIPPDAMSNIESDATLPTVASVFPLEPEETSRLFLADAVPDGAVGLSPQIVDILQRAIPRDAVELFQEAEHIPPESLAILRLAEVISRESEVNPPNLNSYRLYVQDWVQALQARDSGASRQNAESASSAAAFPNRRDILDVTKNLDAEVALRNVKSSIKEVEFIRDKLNETVDSFLDYLDEPRYLLEDHNTNEPDLEDSEDDAMSTSEDNLVDINARNANDDGQQPVFPVSQVTTIGSAAKQTVSKCMASTNVSNDAKRFLKSIENSGSTESHLSIASEEAVTNSMTPSPMVIDSPALSEASATNSGTENWEDTLYLSLGFEPRQRIVHLAENILDTYEELGIHFNENFNELYEIYRMARKGLTEFRKKLKSHEDKLPNENTASPNGLEMIKQYRILERLYRENRICLSILRRELLRIRDECDILTRQRNVDQKDE